MLGETNPQASLPGSIRGDYCIEVGRNICHGSDSPGAAEHEINFWFEASELNDYTSVNENQLYE